MFEEMSIIIQDQQYNFKYSLSHDGKAIEVQVDNVGWFTTWISVPIKHIFDSKKYILKNIKKHNELSEIFKKLNKEEISEIKKKIISMSIESCEMKPLNECNIANLKIKK